MLFNSYVFIFVFLPLTVGVFYLIRPVYRVGFLSMASLVFYAQWSVEATMLLLSSILANYLFACILPKLQHKKLFLALVIGINLVPLVYFKYSVFLHFSTQSLILPLAISFYTFQQIAFLVDLYKEKIKQHTFGEYLFFVLFFPQLIAGPIVHYAQIIAQVRAGALARIQWQYVEAGIVLFSIGLFKKTVLADTFLPLATAAFSHTETLTTFAAWMGLMAYTLGIYFDFSGYTDMAIGLGLFFGLRLPINFDSPYKAVSIVDFWRRWHITLSHFLRDYVYIPLGGNIKGKYTEVLNLYDHDDDRRIVAWQWLELHRMGAFAWGVSCTGAPQRAVLSSCEAAEDTFSFVDIYCCEFVVGFVSCAKSGRGVGVLCCVVWG